MKKKLVGTIIGLVILIGVYLGGVIGGINGNKSLGSVDNENGYYATSTTEFGPQTVGSFKLLKNGPGVLGSVVITNSTAGIINLYDGTTTTNGATYGTTTIAKIAASLAAGTYTFDVNFSKGLVVEFQSTNVATSTITWK